MTTKTRNLQTLSSIVWALRADGVPLADILVHVRAADKEWEPSNQPAFVTSDDAEHNAERDAELTRMAPGKRTSTDQPLTEHDVAARLDTAILRVLRIMHDVDNLGMRRRVLWSRYLTGGALEALRDQVDEWLADRQ